MRSTSFKPAQKAFAPVLCWALVTCPSAAALADGPSPADIAQARELLNQGLDLRSKGDVAGALEKLLTANQLAHTPITGLELGQTYVTAGKLVEARETFLAVGRLAERSEETSRSKTARAQSAKLAAQLRARIPSFTLTLVGATPADGPVVALDAVALPPDAFTSPRLVNPGPHKITGRTAKGASAEAYVELKEGEVRRVELAFSAPPATESTSPGEPPPPPKQVNLAAPKPPTEDSPPPSRSTVLPWVLVGGGAALAVAGAGLMALGSKDANSAVSDLNRSAYDSATGKWTIGLVGVITGSAAAAGGAIWLVTSRGGPGPSQSGASTWISVGVNEVSWRGSW